MDCSATITKCTFNDFTNYSTWKIRVKSNAGEFYYFGNDGSVTSTGEVLLFPSRDEHDWSKFEKPTLPESFTSAKNILTSKESDELTNKLIVFEELITIRNAWWKLDNNWEIDTGGNIDMFAIYCDFGSITADRSKYKASAFMFRTAELRDLFLEKFREELEVCKEFI